MRGFDDIITRKRLLGYSPRYNPALALWICGDNVVADSSDLISQATDLSGRGRHATQSTAAAKPLRVLNARNGHAAMSFDGADDWVVTAGFGLAFPFHVFAAYSQIIQSIDGRLMDGLTGNSAGIYNINTTNYIATYSGGGGPASPSMCVNDEFMLIDVVFNSTGKLAKNGGAQITSTFSSPGTPNGVTLGAYANGIAGWGKIKLLEIAIYSAELTGTARLQECARLACKYGIALS